MVGAVHSQRVLIFRDYYGIWIRRTGFAKIANLFVNRRPRGTIPGVFNAKRVFTCPHPEWHAQYKGQCRVSGTAAFFNCKFSVDQSTGWIGQHTPINYQVFHTRMNSGIKMGLMVCKRTQVRLTHAFGSTVRLGVTHDAPLVYQVDG
ncbi:hypothetical protein A0O30_01710 [Pseudomonas sp. LLC-1]|nr:hypothetical protein A0O30_01710 [Pseudomonas sp. LLC-1]